MFAQPAAGQPPWAARSTVPSSVRCTGRSGRGRAGVIELVIKLNNFEPERSTRLRPLCTFNGLRAEALCPGLRVGHPGAHRPINARSDIPLPPSHVAFAITTRASVVMRSFNAQLHHATICPPCPPFSSRLGTSAFHSHVHTTSPTFRRRTLSQASATSPSSAIKRRWAGPTCLSRA